MSCENAKTGKVTFTDSGITREIQINNCPFSVSCNPVGLAGRMGIRTLFYTCSNPVAACHSGANRTVSSYENETLYLVGVAQSGTYDGNRYDIYGSSPLGIRLVLEGFSFMSGSINIISNVFTPNEIDGLIIKDSLGNTLFNVRGSTCNYTISCDNDCPDGYLKCHSDSYPGYCCIPCGDIKNRITSLIAKVKGLNNG